MVLIALLLVCAVVGFGVIVLLGKQSQSKPSHTAQDSKNSVPGVASEKAAPAYAYSCQAYLFTRAEAVFYRALQDAIADQYLVFGKVRVADVLKPNIEDRSDWQRAFNQISAKHFDFVLCDKNNLKILAVLELDDSSHQRVDRVRRDDFLNQAAASAKLPLLRFPVAATYKSDTIQKTITQSLASASKKPPAQKTSRPKQNPARPVKKSKI